MHGTIFQPIQISDPSKEFFSPRSRVDPECVLQTNTSKQEGLSSRVFEKGKLVPFTEAHFAGRNGSQNTSYAGEYHSPEYVH